MDSPGFFFCICPDAALVREYVERNLVASMSSSSPIPPDVQVFWADEGLDRRFWDALTLLGMDGRSRVLIVRGAHQLPADVWKKLSSLLGTPRPGVLPVLCLECPWEKGQPKLPAHVAKLKCLAFAESRSWVWRSAGIDARSLDRYVQKQASSMGLRFTPEALKTLTQMLIPDASAVRCVLEQLFLASPDGAVDEPLVRQMTEFTPDAVIFDVIRQLESGNARAVWRTLLREGDGGESLLFPLLTLMAREARTLWQLHAGERVYIPQFLENEKRRLAARMGFEGLCRVFAVLQKAELAVKSGARQPLQAMEELVASLSLIFTFPRGEEAASGQ